MTRSFPVLLVGALLAVSLWAQEPEKNTVGVAAKPAAEAEYKIGPQDVVRIDVWKEPEISRTIPVRPDGKISSPLPVKNRRQV
jgi:polysaccharide export outer membrane protein